MDKEQTKKFNTRTYTLMIIRTILGSKSYLYLWLISYFGMLYIIIFPNILPKTMGYNHEIKNDIEKVILNGGSLDNIKHIYNTQKIITSYNNDFISRLYFEQTTELYPLNTPLSHILNDIIIDYYKLGAVDSIFLFKINSLIDQYNSINPFDNLEDEQKYNFENIKLKLKENFSEVQPDLIRISDNLKTKNSLVNEYLEKSTTSYWISILAIIISTFFAVFQLIDSRRSSKIIKTIHKTLQNNLKEEKSERQEKEKIEELPLKYKAEDISK